MAATKTMASSLKKVDMRMMEKRGPLTRRMMKGVMNAVIFKVGSKSENLPSRRV